MRLKIKAMKIHNTHFQHICLIFTLIFFSHAGAWASPAEEIYPGFYECNKATINMAQEIVCWDNAIKYWSEKLEAQYKKIRLACKSAPKPEECRKRLKKMELGWLEYSNSIADFLKNGLLHEQEFATISTIYEAVQFEAWATRRHYEVLKMLE